MTVALGNNIAVPVSSALSNRSAFDIMGKLENYGKLGVSNPDAVIEALFASGEQGAWYDPSDLTTMFQDSAGTTPVTADGQPVGLILDKSGNGNHASQATAAARPLYKTDGTYHWLQFDGVDDSLSTAAINFSTTDKMSIFSGVYVTGGINRGICGFGGGGNSFNSLATATTIFRTTALGTTGSAQTTVTIAAQKNVGTQQLDLAVSSANLATKARVNGVTPTPTVHTDTLVAGSSFGSYALTLGDWIGFVLQGNIYSLIVRGALSTTQKITDTETWVNGKTGAWA